MAREPVRGLFITGTSTHVGKTYVAARIARELRGRKLRVGVYKPAASGCRRDGEQLVADDAVELLEASGAIAALEAVCPQKFAAPLAPHLAAQLEGKTLDAALLRSGLETWLKMSDIVVVEGSGGLMSPLGDELVADLALEFGFPLVIVARDELGVINQVLQTVHVARTYRGGMPVAAVVLDRFDMSDDDASRSTNAQELARRLDVPITLLDEGAEKFCPPLDWWALAMR